MRIVVKICAVLLIAIGVIHIGFGTLNFTDLSPDALWFCGSGLAMIFIGFLNLLYINKTSQNEHRIYACMSNVLFLIFIVLMNYVMLMVPGVIGLITTLILTLSTLSPKLISLKP